jgi:diacylglycerol kinase family enzyme
MDQQVVVLINSESGTVRTIGADAVKQTIQAALKDWECPASVRVLSGKEISRHIQELVQDNAISTIIVGGGDGTIASVAGQLTGTGKSLGILPLGTMNLVAKALGMAPGLPEALAQLRNAERRAIDVGRIGDRIFLHHLSLGIQPRMVRIREKLGYSSRLTKMLAGARALISILFKPQSLRLHMDIDGKSVDLKTPALLVSNNLYDDSIWFKQKHLDRGELGIYCFKPMSTAAFVGLALDLLRGSWRQNMNVEESRAHRLHIERRRRSLRRGGGILATLDGELVLLPLRLEVAIDPRSLDVLAPAKSSTT